LIRVLIADFFIGGFLVALLFVLGAGLASKEKLGSRRRLTISNLTISDILKIITKILEC